MKIGKLGSDLLENDVMPFLGFKREEVVVHSGVGEDAAVVKMGDGVQVLSTDPITGADKSIGRLAVHIACNDVAASGAEPVGILVTILFPEYIDEEDIPLLMEEISSTAEEINVEVIGGHTEVTPAVNKTVISTTAIGKARENRFLTSSNAEVGDAVVMTKTAGLEGTAIIVNDHRELVDHILNKDEIKKAKKMFNQISVIKEGLIASKNKATAAHDVTEGGVKTAAFELARASNKGITLIKKDIPIANVTKKICQELDLDPLGLMSSGTLLITTPNPNKMIKKLKKKQIPAAKIGQIEKKEFKIKENGTEKKLKPLRKDELYKLI
ncbi:Hydrogenase maturation factor HypE [Methanonatronarchaeum thermophilum]|uniref:Hydrogenase maturation factor HypE n=1 Tax=Methanonatronarchaeum thermophilum TaxID=1927129 RepID=A0A1Y3GDC3_9EURY|nr:AIR synthase family protein [Methanonatronarchaeum thermophilum]OUJ19399.1 Hydrogenase maturation factor HypE [Methanonatronarchaeum thermophilum]